MRYRVLIRREVIEEAWVEVEARGRIQAGKKAEMFAMLNEHIAWHTTGVLNKNAYGVMSERKDS